MRGIIMDEVLTLLIYSCNIQSNRGGNWQWIQDPKEPLPAG